jgi:hypothetical protein
LEDPINRHRANFENKIISKLKTIFGFLRWLYGKSIRYTHRLCNCKRSSKY